MKTSFTASGNHYVPISQISFPLTAVFPSHGNIFETNPVAVTTDFLFTGNNVLSFRSFWKPLSQLERGQYFIKSLISATVEETVF